MKTFLMLTTLTPSLLAAPTVLSNTMILNKVLNEDENFREGEVITEGDTYILAQALAHQDKKEDEVEKSRLFFLKWADLGLSKEEEQKIDFDSSYFTYTMEWIYMTNHPKDKDNHEFDIDKTLYFSVKEFDMPWYTESKDWGIYPGHDWRWSYKVNVTDEGLKLETKAWAFAEQDKWGSSGTNASTSIHKINYHIEFN